jgi:SAM-dependent methyltransferase
MKGLVQSIAHTILPMTGLLQSIARTAVPQSLRQSLRSQWQGDGYRPPVGDVRFGDLRRLKPLSDFFGCDRGQPIDRYYIERFVAAHAGDIAGRILEIGDNIYTHQFGGARVTHSDVLHVEPGNPKATIVADLTRADHIPSNTFDCVLLLQTLQLIYDARSAIDTVLRILKPGGVVLATFPGITHVPRSDPKEGWADCWHWSFTATSARRLFGELFPQNNLHVEAFGNVLTATSFLQGLSAAELTPAEFDYRDRDYDMLIGVRAQKPLTAQ